MLTEIRDEPQIARSASPWLVVQRLVAVVALLPALIPMGFVAAVIWLTLGRPLLFRQVRSGQGNRTFTIPKFRTMHDWRDARGNLLPDHQRETRITRWIRRARLDEIPQLFTIAAGQMSFVGPRPLRPETIASFGELGLVRALVPPGLTGWAQVNGNILLSDAEKLALDIWYVDHRSVWLDLRILARTITTITRGERIGAQALAQARDHLARRSWMAARRVMS